MRPWIVLVALGALCSSGCMQYALQRRTVNQASTLSDLQYQQVLDNLAMFCCNPEALPFHLKLNGASIQVTTQGTGMFLETIQGTKPTIYAPSASAQRGVVNQWSGVPTVDAANLELLELAYRRATNPHDPDGRIRAALFAKVAEQSVHYNLVLQKDVLRSVIETSMKLDRVSRWQLQRKNEELHEQLGRMFEQLASFSRPITDAQIDNYAARLAKKIDEDTRGEARAKLQLRQEQQRVNIQQTRVGIEDEIVKLTREACALPYIPRYPATGRVEHNPRDIQLAQDKIKALVDLADDPRFAQPWLGTAPCRARVPHCACYVGHWCKCGCECHVWVDPHQLGTLRDFTLIVLKLAPLEAQESPPAFPTGGVTFSPTLAGGGR